VYFQQLQSSDKMKKIKYIRQRITPYTLPQKFYLQEDSLLSINDNSELSKINKGKLHKMKQIIQEDVETKVYV